MSSRADIAAGRGHTRSHSQAVEIEAPRSPTRRIPCPSVCTVFWFAIAAMFAGLFGWAYTRNIQHGGYDITANATCSADKITLHPPLVAWAQHPAPVAIYQANKSVLSRFEGRNFLAALPGPTHFTGKVGTVDGYSFTVQAKLKLPSNASSSLNVSCQVTLDQMTLPEVLAANAEAKLFITLQKLSVESTLPRPPPGPPSGPPSLPPPPPPSTPPPPSPPSTIVKVVHTVERYHCTKGNTQKYLNLVEGEACFIYAKLENNVINYVYEPPYPNPSQMWFYNNLVESQASGDMWTYPPPLPQTCNKLKTFPCLPKDGPWSESTAKTYGGLYTPYGSAIIKVKGEIYVTTGIQKELIPPAPPSLPPSPPAPPGCPPGYITAFDGCLDLSI